MSRGIAVLRPEPGNHLTAAAIEARGHRAIGIPLFEVRPIAWEPADPADFDALILTSANAIRHGGTGLFPLLALPAYTVGRATAEAAQRMGFEVAAVGSEGAAALLALAQAAGVARALHLGGRDRTLHGGGAIARAVTVYASDPVDPEGAERLDGAVALVQSARAGGRLAEVVDAAGLARSGIAIAALSERAAAAAGSGWERVTVPEARGSDARIAAAIALAD
jgi:uroporphyrinogen-III synthase